MWSCWNRKGPSSNYSHKVRSMKCLKLSYWTIKSIRSFVSWNTGPKPHEKQPHITTASDTLAPHDVRLGYSCSAMETDTMKLSMQWCWANLKAMWSLEACRDWFRKLEKPGYFYAPQHPLTALCDFRWPSTLLLSCCCSQSLPLPPTVGVTLALIAFSQQQCP